MTGPDAIQRRWARVVGFSYVFALAPAVFAEFYVSGRLVSDNAIATAQNIIAHERLFRLGIACNLLVFATDVLLVTALYVVLERVNRHWLCSPRSSASSKPRSSSSRCSTISTCCVFSVGPAISRP